MQWGLSVALWCLQASTAFGAAHGHAAKAASHRLRAEPEQEAAGSIQVPVRATQRLPAHTLAEDAGTAEVLHFLEDPEVEEETDETTFFKKSRDKTKEAANKAVDTTREVVDKINIFKNKEEKAENKSKPMPPYDDFMPACMKHLEKLIIENDRANTDVYLEDHLRSQCEMEERFPNTYEDGFEHKKACLEFSKLLVEARDEHLDNGSKEGYVDFCEKFYVHKGGTLPEGRRKKAEAEGDEDVDGGLGRIRHGWYYLLLVAGALTVFFLVLHFGKSRR